MSDAAPATPPAPPTPPRRGRGRPDRLTDDVQERILAAVANHQRVEVAYELAGVAKGTFYGWLQTAARCRMELDRGSAKRGDLTALERRCLDFSDALTHAMAQAEGFALRDVINAGSRPLVEKRERTRCMGLDAGGVPIMVTETTVTTREPDWRARAWWLESRVPAYRRRQEVSGPGGGPIPVEMAVRLATLADTIRSYQEEQSAIGPG